jgi:hypothetical protein
MAQSEGKIGSLFYGMTLDTKEFSKKLKTARKTLKSAGEEMRQSFKVIAKGGALLATAIGAGSAGMLFFAKSSLEATKSQLLLADSIGATQAEIAGLELATEKWGVETNMVIDKMREFGGLDEFKKLAEEVKNAGDETDQLNKAIEIFGGEGAKMLPLLQQGAQGFADMEKEAKALGLALNPQQIEQSRIVWEELETTWLSIKGLAKQVATAFLQPLGMMSAGIKGFIATFKDGLIGSAETVANSMTNFMRGAFNIFADYGIPFINGFISFAGQIGQAFSQLFTWLEPATNSVMGGLGKMFAKTIDFFSTFRQSITIGITKPIQAVIKFSFNMLAKFSNFVNRIVEELLGGLNAAGLIEDQFLMDYAEAVEDQAGAIRRMGKDLAKPFKEAEEEAFKEMVSIFIDQDKKNEKQIEKFKGFIFKFDNLFKKTIEGVLKKMPVVAVKATKAMAESVSDKMSGLILSGSQEEQMLKNSGGGKMIQLTMESNRTQKQILDSLDGLGTV